MREPPRTTKQGQAAAPPLWTVPAWRWCSRKEEKRQVHQRDLAGLDPSFTKFHNSSETHTPTPPHPHAPTPPQFADSQIRRFGRRRWLRHVAASASAGESVDGLEAESCAVSPPASSCGVSDGGQSDSEGDRGEQYLDIVDIVEPPFNNKNKKGKPTWPLTCVQNELLG